MLMKSFFIYFLTLSVLFLKFIQNHTSCGGGEYFPRTGLKKNQNHADLEERVEQRPRQPGTKLFFSQHAAAVRGTDGGFQHYGQRQLHLHSLATRGDDDGNTQNIVVLCKFHLRISVIFKQKQI